MRWAAIFCQSSCFPQLPSHHLKTDPRWPESQIPSAQAICELPYVAVGNSWRWTGVCHHNRPSGGQKILKKKKKKKGTFPTYRSFRVTFSSKPGCIRLAFFFLSVTLLKIIEAMTHVLLDLILLLSSSSLPWNLINNHSKICHKDFFGVHCFGLFPLTSEVESRVPQNSCT